LIDKEVRLEISPFSECSVSFLEYWFESGYYNGFITKPKPQFTSAGVNVGIDIYKGLQNQNTLQSESLYSCSMARKRTNTTFLSR
jgi:hypothetical protein